MVVSASGCVLPEEEDEGLAETTPGDSKGLEITSFTVTDDTLSPGQEAVVNLALKNHHVKEIQLENPGLYNTGSIDVIEEKSKGCGDSRIRAAQKGLKPFLECSWHIKAPTEEELGEGIESRPFNPQLNLEYESQITNSRDPMQITFKPGEDINSTHEISRTYSNGEVKMTLKGDTPVPVEGSGTLDIELEPIHEQGIMDDEYRVEIRPSSIITQCGDETSEEGDSANLNLPHEIGKQAYTNCRLEASAARQVERNIIVSTSYKYQQSSQLNIKVVSNQ